jgi:hypothetical protein
MRVAVITVAVMAVVIAVVVVVTIGVHWMYLAS